MAEGGIQTTGKFKSDRQPLVSIITVVYNGASQLEATIKSVINEPLKEYLIFDGGSSDGTVEILKRYDSEIDYWSSEKDEGIYDALNKGYRKAKGHFIYTLNIGDELSQLPIDELIQAKRQNADVVLFNVSLSNKMVFKSKVDYRTPFGNTIHHQGAFYRRGLNVQYDLSYKVFSDFDLNQRLFLNKANFIRFDKTICHHSLDGISNNSKYATEYYKVIANNFGTGYAMIGFLYIRLSKLKQFLRRLDRSLRKINIRV